MNNNQNRFTIKAQEAIQYAQDIASGEGHGEFRALHLLLSLIQDPDSLVQPILEKAGIDLIELEDEINKEMNRYPKTHTEVVSNSQLYLSQEAVQILDLSAKFARLSKDEFISTEHMFLALSDLQTQAKTILENFGLKKDIIVRSLAELRGNVRITDEAPESKFKVLEKYAENLTDKAKAGKLDPLIGREDELTRVIQVLSRRTKNNPVLIGEPGVGKTAIVEGLARRIVSGDVPETLKNKEILSLDIGSLVAGTKFRGEFEDRLKAFVKEIKNAAGKYILFIDEIHTIVGAGGAEGAIDASNLLKPALARGELHAVGATTTKEYQKYIEKDAALERRFQPIVVEEPSIEDSVNILRGLKEKYEAHHGLKISDEAIISAVQLSSRYITDRFLPDKAVDVIDEAAAARKLETDSVPQDIAKLKKEITGLEIEEKALIPEATKTKSAARLKEVKKSLSELHAKYDELNAEWSAERMAGENMRNLRRRVDELKQEAEVAERQADLERVARVRYGELPQAEKDLLAYERKYFNKKTEEARFSREAVEKEDVADVIARWTGIPVANLLESEMEKLVRIEDELGKSVVGQEEAIGAISNALRRARAGLADPNRPLGSFMFLGPTGVGKTELARALAKFMFNKEDALIRIDMSEYMERHNVSRLVGSPPGYVGHEEGGQLTEMIRHRPYSLILFDEIEKANPEVFNILLQVLDNGRLTDSKGKIVNFKNTIIILTSNVGSELTKEMSRFGFSSSSDDEVSEKEKDYQIKLKDSLKNHFRPEFLNRLDDIIVFHSLTKTDISKIVDIQLSEVTKRLEDKGVKISFDSNTKKYITENGFDPEFGARPIKRFIQKYVLDKLADKMIRGEIKQDSKVKISFNDSEIKVTCNQAKSKN